MYRAYTRRPGLDSLADLNNVMYSMPIYVEALLEEEKNFRKINKTSVNVLLGNKIDLKQAIRSRKSGC